MSNVKLFFLAVVIILIFVFPAYMQQDLPKHNLTIASQKLTVEIADNPAEQYQGLSGRESLCDDCGMLFVYQEPRILTFIMRGMKFPLDIIFIREGRVVEVYENVPYPRSGEEYARVTSQTAADMVLEVNGGFVSRSSIRERDMVDLGY